jgi:hypothetical protein
VKAMKHLSKNTGRALIFSPMPGQETQDIPANVPQNRSHLRTARATSTEAHGACVTIRG